MFGKRDGWKRLLIGVMTGCMVLGGCGTKNNQQNQNNAGGGSMVQGESTADGLSGSGQSTENRESGGQVYYLSFKPEADSIWQKLAKQYTQQTGVPVKVVTAANNTYEQTLMSEIANKAAPTLFQVNGPVGYQNWKEYCADLKDTQIYDWLLDKNLAISGADGGVYAIPYVVEGYGIIYNDAILAKYIGLEGAKITSVSEINSFEKLRMVAEDMQARKKELGIDGVFASTSLAPGEQWRWQTHLANVPISYEYQEKGVTDAETIAFTYGDRMKDLFDLYLQNSSTAPGLLGNKSVDDSMSEFALGRVAMVQNGNWAWGQIAQVDGNVVEEQNVKFLPIYMGIAGEENQGLCIGTENYLCVNANASPEDQKATIDFVEWLFASPEGKQAVVEEMGLIAPFSTFSEEEKPEDPLAREVLSYMADEEKESVPWNFTTFPSLRFKDNLGAALLEYASGSMSWQQVKEQVVRDWAEEKAAVEE